MYYVLRYRSQNGNEYYWEDHFGLTRNFHVATIYDKIGAAVNGYEYVSVSEIVHNLAMKELGNHVTA